MSRAVFCFLIIPLVLVTASSLYSQSDFQPAVTYSLPQEAATVAVGDLNGDGRDDVVVTAWPSALFVLCQQGDGTLGAPSQLFAPDIPLGLATGDLNGDGRNDVAVGGGNGAIFVYYQQTDGAFGLPYVCSGYGWINSMVIDDLNGDGLNDIAYTCREFPAVLVSLKQTDGTFALPQVYSVSGWNARGICSLDFNSDGRRDVALLLDDQACWLTGNSAGGFDAPSYAAAQWAFALAAGDVTGDRRDDLVFTVATNRPEAAVGVIAQGAEPATATLYPAYDFAQPVALADINADGRKDVVTAHGGWDAISVFPQNTDGSLGSYATYAAPSINNYEVGSLAVGDLNSDGQPDLALADWINGLTVFLHTPQPSGPPPDLSPPVCSANASGTQGANGWYTSPVTVALAAEDETGGSGVEGIFYTLDGSSWSAYSGSFVVATQGTKRIGWNAEDKAGNRSDTNWTEIKIDSVAPAVTITPSLTTLWPPNGDTVNVSVRTTAEDATSGVTSVHLSVRDEYNLVGQEVNLAPGATVEVPLVASRSNTDADGRVYTLVLTGLDAAGNLGVAQATVTVPVSGPKKPKGK